jgi:glycosyltransferase involved in cell wall biosynthesis
MSRYAARSRNLARKLYARRSASTLRRLEQRSVNWFDGHVVVTGRDGDALRNMGCTADIVTVDNGVDSALFCDERLEEAYRVWPDRAAGAARSRVLFVGSMDYYANVDCVLEFVTGAWPRIARQQPQLRFTIVGRNPPPEIRKLAGLPGVEVTGTVPDVRPYYREALASVVPLRIGGGSRLKILEAMAAGIPVVSTQLGAEGLQVRPGEDILLAESGEDFSDALLRLTREEGEWRRIAQAGRQLVRARYEWGPLAVRLHDGYLGVLGRAPR